MVSGGVIDNNQPGVEKSNAAVNHQSLDGSNHGEAAPTSRAEFLSTFTPEEERKIIRKVDYRLLLLCGVIYMVKQVCVQFGCLAQYALLRYMLTGADRRQQRSLCQSALSEEGYQYSGSVAHDGRSV